MHPDDSPQRLFLLRVEGFFSQSNFPNPLSPVIFANLPIRTENYNQHQAD